MTGVAKRRRGVTSRDMLFIVAIPSRGSPSPVARGPLQNGWTDAQERRSCNRRGLGIPALRFLAGLGTVSSLGLIQSWLVQSQSCLRGRSAQSRRPGRPFSHGKHIVYISPCRQSQAPVRCGNGIEPWVAGANGAAQKGQISLLISTGKDRINIGERLRVRHRPEQTSGARVR